MSALHQDAHVIEQGTAALQGMLDLSRSLIYASLLTDDGFEIVHLVHDRIEAGRFASMSSSVQALSDAVAHELRIGDSEYVIIGSDQGYVIQLRVPGHPVVLAALFRAEETLGKALWVARTSAERVAQRITRPAPPAEPAAPLIAYPNF